MAMKRHNNWVNYSCLVREWKRKRCNDDELKNRSHQSDDDGCLTGTLAGN